MLINNFNHKNILSKSLFTTTDHSISLEAAFTMMEMVLVMSVVVVLFLLTIPNIQTTMSVVNDKGCDAQKKIVDAAILQYTLKHDKTPNSISQLMSDGFLREKQNICNDGTEIRIVNGQAE